MKPHLSRLGITRVANVTGLDRIGIPTVVVSRPNARSLSVSQGKGFDLDSAKVSGIMEAVELHHAEHCLLPLVLATYSELRQEHEVVDVTRLPAFVRRFHEHLPLLWTAASALDGRAVYVPYDMVHSNMTFPLEPHAGCFPMGSNGLCSGNSVLEAFVHGACELIERDAVSLFYCEPVAEQLERRVSVSTVDDPRCRELLEKYAAADVAVGIWDVTSDVGIATYFCSIVERELNPFHRIGQANGSGCHLDRAEALKRALTEAAQSRLTRIAGSRDDLQREDVEQLRSEAAILRRQSLLQGHAGAARHFHEAPSFTTDSLDADAELVVRRLEEVELGPPLYVDLSSPDLPVHVVRVIVPGLEGVADAPGYVPGARAAALGAGGAS
jgi:YcaO-like protein with predicted kinase domain